MRSLRYALLLLVSVELAVWESFLVAARPFGRPLPLAAALAVVGNVLVARAGARVLDRPLGAGLPGLVWLAVVLLLGNARAEGDVVVTQSWRGLLFLFGGSIAAALATGVAQAGAIRAQNGASPEGDSRR